MSSDWGFDVDYSFWKDPEISKLLKEDGYTEDLILSIEDLQVFVEKHAIVLEESNSPFWIEALMKFPRLFNYNAAGIPWNKNTKSKNSHSKFQKEIHGVIELKPSKLEDATMKGHLQRCFDNLKTANQPRLREAVLRKLNDHAVAHVLTSEKVFSRKSGAQGRDFQVVVKREVYEYVLGLTRFFFGASLAERKCEYMAKIRDVQAVIGLYHDMGVRGSPAFGSIVLGEIKKPSISPIVELLSGPLTINEADQKSKEILTQLLGYMIVGPCLLGILADGVDYLFLKPTKVEKQGVKTIMCLDYYTTTATDKYMTDTVQLSSPAAMLSLLGTLMIPGPEKYKKLQKSLLGDFRNWAKDYFTNSFFGLKRVENNFSLYKSSFSNNANHEQITYDIPEEGRLAIGTQLNSQVLALPGDKFQLPESQVVAKVFDCNCLLIEKHNRKYNSVRKHMWKLFKDEVTTYEKIKEHNRKYFDIQINMVQIHKKGFYSFWATDSRKLPSYIASGPTIVMERLSQKPSTTADFEKGLDQLARLAAAGILHNDIKLENMFMRDGEFVFIDYGLSVVLKDETPNSLKGESLHLAEDGPPDHFSDLFPFYNTWFENIPSEEVEARSTDFLSRTIRDFRRMVVLYENRMKETTAPVRATRKRPLLE